MPSISRRLFLRQAGIASAATAGAIVLTAPALAPPETDADVTIRWLSDMAVRRGRKTREELANDFAVIRRNWREGMAEYGRQPFTEAEMIISYMTHWGRP